MKKELQKKVDFAINLLQSAEKMAAKVNQPVEICYSGGKDSDVILELARMSGINYRALYKNTTIDPPGTIKHALDNGVEMLRPKKTFLELISKRGYPTRVTRYCCEVLKEYKTLDYAVTGVRRDESTKRAERYKEPEFCYHYSKNVTARQYLPILEWTKDDVAEFVEERNIKCHSLYYDEQGNFHPERRLGCMGCPLTSVKKRILEFKEHPGMIKLYLRGGRNFIDSHPNAKFAANIHNEYELFCMHLFCQNFEEFRMKFGKNLFDDGINCKEFLQDYFKIDLK